MEEELERIKREQDMRFALTLKFMDQSPIIQKVTKMKPYGARKSPWEKEKDESSPNH